LSTREVPGCQWKTLRGFPRYEVSSESALTPALSPRERGWYRRIGLDNGTPQLGRVDNGAALSTREVPGCQWKTLRGFPRYEVSSEAALTLALSPRERGWYRRIG
jgi:hypothetical protein